MTPFQALNYNQGPRATQRNTRLNTAVSPGMLFLLRQMAHLAFGPLVSALKSRFKTRKIWRLDREFFFLRTPRNEVKHQCAEVTSVCRQQACNTESSTTCVCVFLFFWLLCLPYKHIIPLLLCVPPPPLLSVLLVSDCRTLCSGCWWVKIVLKQSTHSHTVLFVVFIFLLSSQICQ